MGSIAENIASVQQRIRAACERSGRRSEDVTLVAVSKTKPADMVREAMQTAGILDFGENKPQELRDKCDILPSEIRWHMIGNLQKNKVKYVVPRAVLIHSVGSKDLAKAIDKEAAKEGKIAQILVEVNMAHEASKGGVSPEECPDLVREIAALENLRIRGLMTVAPATERAEDNRVYFRGLRDLAVDIDAENIDNVSMCELSMGMSGDFEIAVEEGATLVRVGSSIFGERDYSIS